MVTVQEQKQNKTKKHAVRSAIPQRNLRLGWYENWDILVNFARSESSYWDTNYNKVIRVKKREGRDEGS